MPKQIKPAAQDAEAQLKIYKWTDCDATGMPWKN